MAKKKRKDDVRRRKRQARERRLAKRQSSSLVDARKVKLDIHDEIRHITELAQVGQARLVTLGDFVLFSTETRDAWLLDAEDCLALCLARDGEPQPHRIVETANKLAIDWTSQFDIVGDLFIVSDRSGNTKSVWGYPVDQIAQACGLLD